MLCLMQPRILSLNSKGTLLSFVQLGVPQDPKALSAEKLSSWVALTLCWCLGLLLSRCRTLNFPLLNFMRLLSAHLSNLLRSGRQHDSLASQPVPHNFMLSATLMTILLTWPVCDILVYTALFSNH